MRRHNTPEPMRKCIGCQQSLPQSTLIRFTIRDGNVIADLQEKNDGRGVYLCRNAECIEMSFKRKAWNRILRTKADTDKIRNTIGELTGYTKEGMNVKESK